MIMKKIKGVASVFAICLVFAIVASHIPQEFFGISTSSQDIKYILDAGHGIPDGGAVASDGTTEQELNLAITLKVSELLHKQGIAHQLTRSDENSIFTEGETIHAKKVSDVRQRIAIASKTPEIPIISIHMNSYPNASVFGTQVFYSKDDTDAKSLAETLQDAFNEQIQPNHRKTAKTISPNVYLFSHVENPSVLIECGFLSNYEELSKLKTEEYQTKIAEVIVGALCG